MKVYLITSGDGADGNEWSVIEVCASRKIAEFRAALLGEDDRWNNHIEEWNVMDYFSINPQTDNDITVVRGEEV